MAGAAGGALARGARTHAIRSACRRSSSRTLPHPPPATSACARRTSTAPTRCPPAPSGARRSRSSTPTTTRRPKPTCAPTTKNSRLPACTTDNGCFKQVNEKGETAQPAVPEKRRGTERSARAEPTPSELAEEATGWGLEISLDIETAHAVCQTCHILLVEANSPLGRRTWKPPSAPPRRSARERDQQLLGRARGRRDPKRESCEGPFNHPGTVITASAGDNGYLDWDSSIPGAVEFPAASPHVVAVGGTRLQLSTERGVGGRERCGTASAPAAEAAARSSRRPRGSRRCPAGRAVGCAGARAVADVAADADPYTGVAVYRLAHARMRIPRQTRAALVHARRHEPRLAADRRRVRARRRLARRRLPGRNAVRERRSPRREALHDVIVGLQRRMHPALRRSNGPLGLHRRRRRRRACGEQRDLPRRRPATTGPPALGTPDGDRRVPARGGGGEAATAARNRRSRRTKPRRANGLPAGNPRPPSGSAAARDPRRRRREARPGADRRRRRRRRRRSGSPPAAGRDLGAGADARQRAGRAELPPPALAARLLVPRERRRARVRVSLAKRVISRRHTRWHTLHRSATISGQERSQQRQARDRAARRRHLPADAQAGARPPRAR